MPKRIADTEGDRARKRSRWGRIIYSESDSTDNESDSDANQDGHHVNLITNVQVHNASSADVSLTPPNPPTDSVPNVAVEHEEPVPEVLPSQDPPLEQPTEGTLPELELDPELLKALGELTDDTPDFGDKILDNLAKLWLPILKKGLSKENKDKLRKEYLIPENCRLLQAPKLNAEIESAVLDPVRNRDKGIMLNQQQLGFGITAINRGLDSLLKGDDIKQAIQHLSNSCRILSDLHSTLSQNRIKLLTQSLDKGCYHVIKDSERDDTLFGNKLSEKIKAAKTIERQGLQIKKTNNSKGPSSNTASASSSRSNSGNWTGPARYQTSRGGRGGWRRSPAPPPPPRRQYPPPPQHPPRGPAASKPRAPAPNAQ